MGSYIHYCGFLFIVPRVVLGPFSFLALAQRSADLLGHKEERESETKDEKKEEAEEQVGERAARRATSQVCKIEPWAKLPTGYPSCPTWTSPSRSASATAQTPPRERAESTAHLAFPLRVLRPRGVAPGDPFLPDLGGPEGPLTRGRKVSPHHRCSSWSPILRARGSSK